MNLAALIAKPSSLFAAMGGWHTLGEVIASRALFLIAYLLTGRVLTAALVAAGGVVISALVRVFADRRYWQAALSLVTVAVSASVAGGTGHSVDFYLPGVVTNVAGAAVFGGSLLLRRPLIGVVLARTHGERDRAHGRRYELCTAVFLAKFCFATAVLLPLYLTGRLVALGIAETLLTLPALGVCGYLSWRILRTHDQPARCV
ncbi:DUF3159 domain-containing protein [Amycolatopsis sp. NPDC004169]|uniref:DUF3159 domain-containing protein n=1 Tax=Amycolatopsis sp. NPDC004169 TaxID=3154453 RepID=UPI0033B451DD